MSSGPVSFEMVAAFFKEINKPGIKDILERLWCSPEEASASKGLFHASCDLPSSLLSSRGVWETVIQLADQQLEICRNVCVFDQNMDNMISSFLQASVDKNSTLGPTEEKRNALEWLVAYNHMQQNWDHHRSMCKTCSSFSRLLLELPTLVVTDEVKGDPSNGEHQSLVPFNPDKQLPWDAFFSINQIERTFSKPMVDKPVTILFPLNPAQAQAPPQTCTLSSAMNGGPCFTQGTLGGGHGQDTHMSAAWVPMGTDTQLPIPANPLGPNGDPFVPMYSAERGYDYNTDQPLCGAADAAVAVADGANEDEAAPGLMDNIMRRAEDTAYDDEDDTDDSELPLHLAQTHLDDEPDTQDDEDDDDTEEEEPDNHNNNPELYQVKAISHEQHHQGPEKKFESFRPKEELYRKKLCSYFFFNGFCSKGDSCNFSHEKIDGAPEPTRPEDVGKGRPSPTGYVDREDLKGTKPCKWFTQRGYCKKGDKCTFSHDLSLCRPGLLPTPSGAYVVSSAPMNCDPRGYQFVPCYPPPPPEAQQTGQPCRQQQQPRWERQQPRDGTRAQQRGRWERQQPRDETRQPRQPCKEHQQPRDGTRPPQQPRQEHQQPRDGTRQQNTSQRRNTRRSPKRDEPKK